MKAHRRRLAGTALVLGSVCASYVATRPQPTLIQSAERLHDFGRTRLVNYSWIGPDALVAWERADQRLEGEAVRWSFEKGPLRQRLRMPERSRAPYTWRGRWSPSGTMAVSTLEPDYITTGRGSDLFMITRDQNRVRSLRNLWVISNPVWSRDGKMLALLAAAMMPGGGRIDTKSGLRIVIVDPVTGAYHAGPPFGWPRGGWYIWGQADDALMGAATDGSWVGIGGQSNSSFFDAREINFFSVPRDGGQCRMKEWRVDLKPDQRATSLSLSPSGDRLAWLVVGLRPVSTSETWLARLLRREPNREYGIWLRITAVDGKSQRVIGFEPIKKPRKVELESLLNAVWAPRGLRWLPDGKRVSFLYRGSLYRIAVD